MYLKIRKKWQFTIDLIMIMLGTIIMGVSFSVFMSPNNISTGGFSGLALIINSIFGLVGINFIPSSVIYFVLNIVLYIFAFKMLGKKFAIKAFFGIASYSIFMEVFELLNINLTYEPLLSSIYGGLLMGLGVGIVVRFGGSTGGSDMIACMVRHKNEKVSIGKIIVLVDIVVLTLSLFVFSNGIEILPYTIIALTISIYLTDFVNDGYKQVKAYYIITTMPEEVSSVIMNKLNRGCTMTNATGMFDKTNKFCLTCLVSKFQTTTLKRIVKDIDAQAFVFATSVTEVVGEWAKNDQYCEEETPKSGKFVTANKSNNKDNIEAKSETKKTKEKPED